MIDPTKTSPEKLAEMNDSLIADNNYLRAQLLEHKRARYRAGLYKFKAPPVCTTRWTEDDWITYIDACRGWLE